MLLGALVDETLVCFLVTDAALGRVCHRPRPVLDVATVLEVFSDFVGNVQDGDEEDDVHVGHDEVQVPEDEVDGVHWFSLGRCHLNPCFLRETKT